MFWDLRADKVWLCAGGSLQSLSWSSSRSLAAVAFAANRYPYLVGQAASNMVLGARKGQWGLSRVAWSPREDLLACADNDSVEIWSADLSQRIARFDGLPARVKRLAWSPDGRYLASVGEGLYTYDPKEVHVWCVDELRPAMKMDADGKCQPVLAWSPHGGVLAGVNSEGAVALWEAETGNRKALIDTGVERIIFLSWSPDGMFLAGACGDHQVRIWDVANRRLAVACVGHDGIVAVVSWSPNGRYVASVSEDKSLRLWSPLTGASLAVADAPYRPMDLLWSTDSEKLTIVSYDNVMSAWILPREVSDLASLEEGLETRPLTVEERRRFHL